MLLSTWLLCFPIACQNSPNHLRSSKPEPMERGIFLTQRHTFLSLPSWSTGHIITQNSFSTTLKVKVIFHSFNLLKVRSIVRLEAISYLQLPDKSKSYLHTSCMWWHRMYIILSKGRNTGMVKKRWNKATPKQAGKAPNIGDPSLLPWTSADKTLDSTVPEFCLLQQPSIT